MYQTTEVDGIIIVKPSEALDITNALPFRNWIKDNFLNREADIKALALDLSDVNEVDSFALGIFIAIYKDAKTKDIKFFLLSPSDKVKRVLGITSLDKILPIEDDISKIKELVE